MQIKYTDELQHWYNRDQKSGNPYRSDTGNKGQFGFSPERHTGDYEINSRNKYASDITYRRRYNENTGERLNPREDGTYEITGRGTIYTPAGLKRKEYEESVNSARSRKNKLDKDALYDTERWIRDDYKNFSDVAKGVSDAARGTASMIDMFNVPIKKGRIDLSQMTDSELNNILNRERMERTYNEYFNADHKNKGADYAKKFFDFVAWSGQQAMTAAQIVSAIRSFKS